MGKELKLNKIKYKKGEIVQSWLYLLPFLIVFVIFLGVPIFYSFYLSLQQFVLGKTRLYDIFGTLQFVGFENYLLVAKDFEFWSSLAVTLVYMVFTIPLSIFLSLLLAVVINNKIKGLYFFRSAIFMPYVLDMLAITFIWKMMYSPDGVFDNMLRTIGIDYFHELGFLGNPKTALFSVGFAMVIKNCGFGMVLFLTALANISPNIFEAADIDGLSWWQKFRYITLPLVKPISLFLAVTGVIASLNAFTEFYAMTGGGPGIVIGDTVVGTTKASGLYLFERFNNKQYGYAATMSYFLLVFALIISWLNFKFLSKKEVA